MTISTVIAGLAALMAVLLATLTLYAFYAAWRIYRPDRPKIERTPADFGIPFEPLSFPAADGRVELSGWLMRAPQVARRGHTIVLCHQWGAHKGFALSHAQFYHKSGFDVVAFDLRNHGDSGYDSSIRLMSLRFTNDVRGTVEAAYRHPALSGNRLSLHAFSFSTFPAMAAALDADQQGISSLVFDSGPTLHTKHIVYGFFDTIGVKLLPRVLRLPVIYQVFRALLKTATLMMLATDWPSPRLKGAPIPALFITGEADSVARQADVEPIARLVADGKLVVLPGVKHLGGLRSQRDLYISTVLAFHERLSAAPTLTKCE